MSRASRTRGRTTGGNGAGPDPRTSPATVASLGVQARLVPVDPARDQELAHLIARCSAVFREWERLVRQAVHLLGYNPAAGSGPDRSEPDSDQG
ncbi:hypothetical protein ILT44_24400 [Microvirga sp. BT689]|uniref:hypothetical protein n=1 Tax=Microvirga arvi TaxID=2778731 RepID=UPI001951A712|nr:hypothetical protein [Microvirga arvi]MBM6583348.1 hypothetical protein [Microvirga arvi]